MNAQKNLSLILWVVNIFYYAVNNNTFMKKKIISSIFLIVLFTSGILILIPNFFNIPVYWDAMEYDVPISLNIFSNINYLFNMNISARPPLSYIIQGSFYKIFGFSLFTYHLINLLFAVLLLLYIYKLIFFITNNNLKSLCSSISVLFFPMFLGQTGITQPYIMFSFFFVASIYYYLKNSKLYFLYCLGLIFTHQVGLLVPFYFLFLEILKFKNISKINFVFNISLLLLFSIWWGISFYFSHSYANPEHINYIKKSFSIHVYLNNLINRLRIFMFRPPNFILLVVFLYTAIINYKCNFFQKKLFKIIFIFLGLIIFYIISLSLFSTFLPRYFLHLYFLLTICIFILLPLNNSLKTKIPFLISIFLILLFFNLYRYNPKSKAWFAEENLQYLHYIDLSQQLGNFIDKNYSDFLIICEFPHYFELTYPEYGYVKKTHKAIRYDNFLKMKNMPENKIFIYSSYSINNKYINNFLTNIKNKKLIKKITKNTDFILIYKEY